MKYYIIAGEASGDWHGSLLMKEILQLDQNAQIRFWGGDLMLKYSSNIAKHYKDTAFMGLWEVLKNIKTIWQNISFCKKDIIAFAPDVVVFIDYPAFNLKIAKFTKKRGFTNVYYISPKIWAWKKGRVKQIKIYIDKMLTIFPFEVDFYKRYNYEAVYVGNPTAFEIVSFRKTEFDKNIFRKKNNLNDKPIVALLPGSRKQEIEKLLPLYTDIANYFADYQFVVAAMSSIDQQLYKTTNENIKFIFDQTYDLLRCCEAAIVTSGTATLETALFDIPQIVCYKTSWFTYFIGRLVLKINFISLVNILVNEKIVEEIIQIDMLNRIKQELSLILYNEQHKTKILEGYKFLRNLLKTENAPLNAAKIVVEKANRKNSCREDT